MNQYDSTLGADYHETLNNLRADGHALRVRYRTGGYVFQDKINPMKKEEPLPGPWRAIGQKATMDLYDANDKIIGYIVIPDRNMRYMDVLANQFAAIPDLMTALKELSQMAGIAPWVTDPETKEHVLRQTNKARELMKRINTRITLTWSNEYYEDVRDRIEEKLEITTSDAQGVIGAAMLKAGYIIAQFEARGVHHADAARYIMEITSSEPGTKPIMP